MPVFEPRTLPVASSHADHWAMMTWFRWKILFWPAIPVLSPHWLVKIYNTGVYSKTNHGKFCFSNFSLSSPLRLYFLTFFHCSFYLYTFFHRSLVLFSLFPLFYIISLLTNRVSLSLLLSIIMCFIILCPFYFLYFLAALVFLFFSMYFFSVYTAEVLGIKFA